MPEGKGALREVLPKQGTGGGGTGGGRRGTAQHGPGPHRGASPPPAGQLSLEDAASMVLCKPKVLPLKSVSLEKLEALQRAALEAARPPEEAPPPRA